MQVIFFSRGVRSEPRIKDKDKIGTNVLVETERRSGLGILLSNRSTDIGKANRDMAKFEGYYHMSAGDVNKMICGSGNMLDGTRAEGMCNAFAKIHSDDLPA